MKNRRNYYRVLHVQPDAPVELIKASYRTLMHKMKRHPDLGGDHETAVIINEAYDTLIESSRRRNYFRRPLTPPGIRFRTTAVQVKYLSR